MWTNICIYIKKLIKEQSIDDIADVVPAEISFVDETY